MRWIILMELIFIPNMNVTIYTTKRCPYSGLTRDYLKEKGISFVEKDCGESPENANEMVRVSGQMGVPVIVIEDHAPIIGWNKDEIELTLEKALKK